MKKTTIFTVLFSLVCFWASADVLLDETFSTNTAGSDLKDIWSTNGTSLPTAEGAGVFVTESALTYSDANGEYILSGDGKGLEIINPASSGANSGRYYKALGATLNSGVFYMSFLYKANVAQTQEASDVLSFLAGNNNNQQCITLFSGKGIVDAEKVRFGVLNEGTTTTNITWGTEEFDVNATLFIVLKQDITNSRTTSVYVNPPLAASEPAQALASNASGTNNRNPHSIMTRLGESVANFLVSGIRVSNTWAEAVGKKSTAPQLAAPAVGTASDVTIETFTANWTAVDNAIGYIVNLYADNSLVNSYTAEGQATSLLAVNGLQPATTYTYKVIAKGDLTNYSNSEESAASAPFTTLEAPETIAADFSDGTWGSVAETIPATGEFPTWNANGFIIDNGVLYANKQTGPRDEVHENAIILDKKASLGMLTLPTVKSIEQIEIHTYSGSSTSVRTFTIRKQNGNNWEEVGTYTTTRNDTIFLIPVSSATPIKLRIENNSNGNIYFSQIITRTANPALLTVPTALDATIPTADGFTANWETVDNASGYKVIVYRGTTFVDTYTATGQATTSLAITGLSSNMTYTYKVLATGDNTSYVDSYVSNEIEARTDSDGTGIFDIEYDSSVLYAINNVVYTTEPGILSIYTLQGSLVLQSVISDKLECNLNAGIYVTCLQTAAGKQITNKIHFK